ncbi:MAG: DUF4293 family protein [Ginsengibacter sp.]
MIQRVQTLWMILAALAVFLTIKFSFYSYPLAVSDVYQTIAATDNFLLLILTSALGTGIVINIFLFKHRSIQFRILVIALFWEFLILYIYYREMSKFPTGNLNIGSVLHLLVIIFIIFAAKGVYNDSKLIKESNRLR